MKKNAFFNEQDQLSSHRAEGRYTDKIIEDSNFGDQWINSNANTDRGHYQNLLNNPEVSDIKNHEKAATKDYDKKDSKKKMISRNKIENLIERRIEDGKSSKTNDYEKPKLEIQVDTIVHSNWEFKNTGERSRNEFKFKTSTPNTLEIDSDTKEITSSGTKTKKTELSKHAQMIMDKLNIPKPEWISYTEASININKHNEEEKGALIEEFDQSRPMTTRIYDDEDDQQLSIQYDCDKAPKWDSNKHMSVEAGLERISKEEFNEPEIMNDLDQEQYSMIIKNIDEDEEGYDFMSQIETPIQDRGFNQPEEHNNDEDVMTVIEKDWDNEINF